MGDASISRERVIQACRATRAHEFIERRPGGYDGLLAENGRDISAGERQLISVARALSRDPKVLILDEATASVDPGTEQLIVNALELLMQGRTSIVIAHRLSTVSNADRILVMEGGRIVEDGPPAKLFSGSTHFSRLRGAQSDEAAGAWATVPPP